MGKLPSGGEKNIFMGYHEFIWVMFTLALPNLKTILRYAARNKNGRFTRYLYLVVPYKSIPVYLVFER